MLSGSLTSQPSARTSTPSFCSSPAACRHRSFLRAQSTRFAPISAKPSAICRPSPTDPPVTIAARPERSKSFLTFTGESSTGLPRSFSIVVPVLVVGVERPQVLVGMELYEGRGDRNNPSAGSRKNIETGTERFRRIVEIRHLQGAPLTGIQPV